MNNQTNPTLTKTENNQTNLTSTNTMYNQPDYYDQFIYGKLGAYTEYEVLACSSNLKDKLQQLETIAQTYKIGNSNPAYYEESCTSAVGIFNYSFSEQDYLVIVQEIIPCRNLFRETFPQYRYVLFPKEQLSSLKYKTFNLILEFFQPEMARVDSLRQKTNDYQKFFIPLAQLSIPQSGHQHLEEKDIRPELIKLCCEETYNQDSKFLFFALRSLINGQRVLIKDEPGKLSPEYHYLISILSLLPAICRSEVQIAVGDFNEQECDWANLLLKWSDSNFASFPLNCISFERQQGNIIGFDNQNSHQLEYIRIVCEIITKRPDKISTLIKDLDSITNTSINLSKLREPQIKETLKSEQQLGKSHQITVYGTSGSGKSTFLVRLHDAIQKRKSEFELIKIDDKTDKFIKNLEKEIFTGKPVPRTNPSETRLELFTMTLAESYRLLNPQIEFSFIDPPGVFFEQIGLENQQRIKIIDQRNGETSEMTFIEYLSSCKGIIFLIDPERKKVNIGQQNVSSHSLVPYQTILRNLFQALKEHGKNNSERIREGKLTQYMAFTLTKIDKGELWERRNENPTDLVREFLGSAL